jgi:serine/threonine protein kinase
MQRNITIITPQNTKRDIILGKLIYSGASNVFDGKDQKTSEKLAIKSLPYGSDISIYLCEREIDISQTIANSNLSNLMHIYGSYAELKIDQLDDEEVRIGRCYIAMPYFENGTLEKWLTASYHVTPEQQFNMTKSILTGINHMHQLGILHRDLKPANILLDDNMEPIITDFGSSTFEASAILNDVRGSSLYMSPDVLLAYFVDEKAYPHMQSREDDMYSFSVVTWCIYAQDDSPFIKRFYYLDEHQALSKLIKHVIVDNKRDDIPKDCPPNVAELIQEGWDSNPENRPTAQTALERFSLFSSLPAVVPIITITDENNITFTY